MNQFRSYCSTDEKTRCDVCINWDGTAIQETGALQGCISLVSECFNDVVDLGCFNDSTVEQCNDDVGMTHPINYLFISNIVITNS
jgi:hypothetical protein